MPDPIWKVIQRYNEQTTQLGWTLSSYVQSASPPEVGDVPFAGWITAYMNVCSPSVSLVDCRISSVGTYRDEYIIRGSAFPDSQGTLGDEATEIASYVQLRLQGGRILQGSSAWKLHGISADIVFGSAIAPGSPVWVALLAAGLAWFRLYRPVATPNMPSVTTPAAFVTGEVSGMYSRRLGRPFSSPGQQRRYTRTG